VLSQVSIQTHSLALRALRALRKRKKRKRLRWRWQAANHGCHCFNQAFLLAGACVCCVKFSRNKRKRLRLNGNRALLLIAAQLSHYVLYSVVAVTFVSMRRSVNVRV